MISDMFFLSKFSRTGVFTPPANNTKSLVSQAIAVGVTRRWTMAKHVDAKGNLNHFCSQKRNVGVSILRLGMRITTFLVPLL